MMMMMAIDIGIKNLAYCIACTDASGLFVIQRWSNVNLLQASESEPDVPTCVTCGKVAKACSKGGFVCMRHVPNDRPLAVDAATGAPIAKRNLATMRSVLAARGLKTSGPLRVLVERALDVATLPLVQVKSKRARDFAMDTNRLHDAIRGWIDRDWPHIRDVTAVFIEHQPVMKNPTMKTVQILVYATLRDRLLASRSHGPDVSFHFTHASTKVRGGDASTGDAGYKSRKAHAKSRALQFLEQPDAHPDNRSWHSWLSQQKKTDDLSDALCMLLDAAAPSVGKGSARPRTAAVVEHHDIIL